MSGTRIARPAVRLRHVIKYIAIFQLRQ
jgi:hypothetical protein